MTRGTEKIYVVTTETYLQGTRTIAVIGEKVMHRLSCTGYVTPDIFTVRQFVYVVC